MVDQKMRSLRVLYLLEFVSTAGFAVNLPSLWPYVSHLGGSTAMLGYIVTAGSFGMFIGSPIVGRLADRLGHKAILQASLALGIGAALLYSLSNAPWMLLVARFVSGFSGGRQAVCQAYVVAVTTEAERTAAMSLMGASSILGIATGPAIGTVVSFIDVKIGPVEINQYNASGWVWLVLSSICVCLVWGWFVDLEQQRVDSMLFAQPLLPTDSEAVAAAAGAAPSGAAGAAPPNSVLVSSVSDLNPSQSGDLSFFRPMCCGFSALSFFAIIFQFCGTTAYIILETVLPPVMDDEYNFGVLYNGITWICAAVVGVFSYVALQLLTRRGTPDLPLFIFGQSIYLVGLLFLAPWPWQIQMTLDASSVPQLPFWRFVVGTFFCVFGFAQSDAISFSLFSKGLSASSNKAETGLDSRTSSSAEPVKRGSGSERSDTGSQMGHILAAQSLACMVGPTAGTFFYDDIGRQVFTFTCGLLVTSLGLAIVYFRRLHRPHLAKQPGPDFVASGNRVSSAVSGSNSPARTLVVGRGNGGGGRNGYAQSRTNGHYQQHHSALHHHAPIEDSFHEEEYDDDPLPPDHDDEHDRERDEEQGGEQLDADSEALLRAEHDLASDRAQHVLVH